MWAFAEGWHVYQKQAETLMRRREQTLSARFGTLVGEMNDPHAALRAWAGEMYEPYLAPGAALTDSTDRPCRARTSFGVLLPLGRQRLIRPAPSTVCSRTSFPDSSSPKRPSTGLQLVSPIATGSRIRQAAT